MSQVQQKKKNAKKQLFRILYLACDIHLKSITLTKCIFATNFNQKKKKNTAIKQI